MPLRTVKRGRGPSPTHDYFRSRVSPCAVCFPHLRQNLDKDSLSVTFCRFLLVTYPCVLQTLHSMTNFVCGIILYLLVEFNNDGSEE
jgi:hypothetical protein